MKRIWLKEFEKNPEQIIGFKYVTILINYAENEKYLRVKMQNLGFEYISTRFVGPDLMDTEQLFKKI